MHVHGKAAICFGFQTLPANCDVSDGVTDYSQTVPGREKLGGCARAFVHDPWSHDRGAKVADVCNLQIIYDGKCQQVPTGVFSATNATNATQDEV